MIQVIPLNEIVATQLQNVQNQNVYVTSLDLISKLLTREFPIKNRNIAIKNILEFLAYADMTMDYNETSKVMITRDVFYKNFGKTYKKYINLLQELNVMTRVPNAQGEYYKPNEFACSYRFHNEYRFSESCVVLLDTKKSRNFSIETRTHKKFEQTIKCAEIDYASALKDEVDNMKDLNSLRKRLSFLFSTHANRFIRKGTKSDRIYHSFSNLSKISRKHIHIDGKRFKEIDITNCQPMLLCYYLKNNGLKFDENYIKDCNNGLFYENFVDIEDIFSVKINGYFIKKFMKLDRDSVKKQLYSSIFFNFDTRNPVNKRFQELYPNTHETLRTLNLQSTLASILQNVEASIFNSIVPKDSKNFFTLHDAIYYTEETDTEYLKSILLEKFSMLNLTPKFK